MSEFMVDGYVDGSVIGPNEFRATVLVNKKVQSVPGDGNCFFHSLAVLLNNQFPGKKITHKDIRKRICDYYHATFRSGATKALANLKRGSELQKKLFEYYTFGAVEGDPYVLDDEYEAHQNEVCNEDVWGEIPDIIVASMLYNINIVVFSQLQASESGPKGSYSVSTYTNDHSYPTFLFKLQMKGANSHYEPLVDKSTSSHVSKMRSISLKPKSSSKDKRKTRKLKKNTFLDQLNSLQSKLNTFYEKIDKVVSSKNREEIGNEFSDIQYDVSIMISELDVKPSLSSSSSSSSLSSKKISTSPSQKQKIMNEIASLTTMLELVEAKDKSNIQKQIKDLQSQL